MKRVVDAQTMSRNRILGNRTLWYQPGSEANEIVQVLNEYVQTSGAYYLVQVIDREGQLIAVNDRDSQGQPIRTDVLYGKNFRSASWFQALQQSVKDSVADSALTHVPGEEPVFVEDVAIDRDVKVNFSSRKWIIGGLLSSHL